MPNVVKLIPAVAHPLALLEVRPFHREGAGLRGIVVENLDGSNGLIASTGYRLGRFALLTTGNTYFRAAARDSNSLWSEFCPVVNSTIDAFTSGASEASIGSGATNDNNIASPGICFPDIAHGSSRMKIFRTLVGTEFFSETRSVGAPNSRSAFSVKLDSSDSSDTQLLHRLWRATQGPQMPWFFDYVEPASGDRTTGISNRYLVKFRDDKLADSLHNTNASEFSFSLVEQNECPAGGNTYEPTPPSQPDLTAAKAPANFIETKWQFEPSGHLDLSPKWSAATTANQINVNVVRAGTPAYLSCLSSGASRYLYNTSANRIHVRVGIDFNVKAGGTSQVGVTLRYKSSSDYIIAYVTSGGSFVVKEVIAASATTILTAVVAVGGVGSVGAIQVEIIGNRLRWWYENGQSVQDRPPDGAADLNGSYDNTHNHWGVYMLGTGGMTITRFAATELPGAVMPPPMVIAATATDYALSTGYNLTPITLSLATDLSGTWIDWEVLPDDAADFPEPYRSRTLISITTHTVYVRPGYQYQARARVNGTPWSEYVTVLKGTASGTGWKSHSQLTTNWPTQDYYVSGDTTPDAAQYNFPAIAPDYVLEGSDDSMCIPLTSNTGKDTATSYDRRPRRTFKLTFDNKGSADYQVLIDFFDFMQGRIGGFNWTHPITGEAFILRFNADDYERVDADQSDQLDSAISSISLPCIEAPLPGEVVPTYGVTLALDSSILTAHPPASSSIWT